MQIVYDRSVDAAHVYFRSILASGEVVRTEPCDVEIREGAIILEFDAAGRLIGLEILGASRVLPAEALDAAERSL